MNFCRIKLIEHTRGLILIVTVVCGTPVERDSSTSLSEPDDSSFTAENVDDYQETPPHGDLALSVSSEDEHPDSEPGQLEGPCKMKYNANVGFLCAESDTND